MVLTLSGEDVRSFFLGSRRPSPTDQQSKLDNEPTTTGEGEGGVGVGAGDIEKAQVAGEGNVDVTGELEYPKGAKLALILLALLVTEFLAGLDQTITAAAAASVANEFHSLTSVGWYGSAYLLTCCSLQPLAGRSYNFFPQKWVFMGSLSMFGVASLICALAKSDPVFIFGRACQGVGYAGIYTGLFMIGGSVLPTRMQALYTGLISGAWGVGASLGPLLGGALSTKLSWRWCFWINLPPIGIMILVLIFFVHPPSIPQTLSIKQRLLQMDWAGAALLTAGMTCILTALQEGGITQPWKSGRIVGLLVAFGVLVGGFFALQVWLGEKASICIRVANQKNMVFLAVLNATVGATYFSVLYAEPTYFQAVRGSNALTSGVQTIATIVPCVVTGVAVGWTVSQRRRFRLEMVLGTLWSAVGAGLLSTFNKDTGAGRWIGYQIITGAGIGTSYMLSYIATQAIIPVPDRRAAATVVIFTQLFGATLWVSASQSIYQNRLLEGILKIPGLDIQLVIDSGVSEFRKVVPVELLPAVVDEAVKALFAVFVAISAIASLGFLSTFGVDKDQIP
ncbi:MFS general substrate transporter [Meredithblackwellia eburnea MCA 4105]